MDITLDVAAASESAKDKEGCGVETFWGVSKHEARSVLDDYDAMA